MEIIVMVGLAQRFWERLADWLIATSRSASQNVAWLEPHLYQRAVAH